MTDDQPGDGSDEASAAVAVARAGAALRRAIEHAARGERATALTALDHALAIAPRSGLVHLIAGRLLAQLRRPQAALDHLDAAAALSPALVMPALSARAALCSRLDWCHDYLDTVARAIAIAADPIPWHAQAARLLARKRDHAAALDQLRLAVAAGANAPRLHLEAATLLRRLGRRDEGCRAVAMALSHGDGSPELLVAAAERLLDLGALDEARALLEQAAAVHPAAHAGLGELALQRGDLMAVHEHAARLAVPPTDDPGAALRLSGAAHLLAGDAAAALVDLDGALRRRRDDYRALTLRGESTLRLGNPEAAIADFEAAVVACRDTLLPAKLLRLLASIQAGHHHDPIGDDPSDEIRAALIELRPESLAVLRGHRQREVAVLLESCLAALRGSRGSATTFCPEGATEPRRLTVVDSPRDASRWALELCRTAPFTEVMRQFDRVIGAYPNSALPLCHRGELQLWFGRYAEARADFTAAISLDAFVRWGYIGLTGALLLEGDPVAALAVCEEGQRRKHGSTGPSLFAYRGEVYRKLGRLDLAIADLQHAVTTHPSRIGAWLNLALAFGEAGDLAAQSDLFMRLRERAVGLFSDAGAATTRDPFTGDPPPRDVMVGLLEGARGMMRGNRSSTCVTYFTANGRLRLVPTHPRESLADSDAAEIAQLRRLLGARR